MQSLKEKRKELWDFIEHELGIKMTPEQHAHVRKFIVDYSSLQNEQLVKQHMDWVESRTRKRAEARKKQEERIAKKSLG